MCHATGSTGCSKLSSVCACNLACKKPNPVITRGSQSNYRNGKVYKNYSSDSSIYSCVSLCPAFSASDCSCACLLGVCAFLADWCQHILYITAIVRQQSHLCRVLAKLSTKNSFPYGIDRVSQCIDT